MNPSSSGIRLSEFTALIKQTLDDRFAGQTFWVIAEISSLNHHARSNMYYFHLIEKEEHSGQIKSEISAVAFSQLAKSIEEFASSPSPAAGETAWSSPRRWAR